MKFGENLQSHITHEWRTQYIDYERLKNVLYEYKEEAPAEDSVEANEIQRYLQQESFFLDFDFLNGDSPDLSLKIITQEIRKSRKMKFVWLQ